MSAPARWLVVGAMALAGLVVLLVYAGGPAPREAMRRDAMSLLESTGGGEAAAVRWLQQERGISEPEAREALAALLEGARGSAGTVMTPGVHLGIPDGTGRVRWRAIDDTEGSPGRHVVLLVHGLDEPGTIWDDLAPALIGASHVVARFEYPNDQRIAGSAELMDASMRDLRARGVERVSLVCHSMGGLVSYDMLTRPAFLEHGTARPTFDRLITLGTPFGGSPWAPLQWIAEVREQFLRWAASGTTDQAALMASLRDGVGEAGSDLAIGSPFLVELLERARPTLAITNVRGRVTPDEARDAAALLGGGWARRVLGSDAAMLRERALEGIAALGDGVVPHGSAVLPGVTDVVEVRANHRSMVCRLALDVGTPPAIDAVLERLGEPPG